MILSVSNVLKRALVPYQKFPKFIISFIILLFIPTLLIGINTFANDLMDVNAALVNLGNPEANITRKIIVNIGNAVMYVALFWFGLGLIHAIRDIDNGDKHDSITHYLKKTRQFIIPVFGLTAVVGLTICALPLGYAIFNKGIHSIQNLMILYFLFIPGALLSIFLMFAPQVRMFEGKKGLQAFIRSNSLVAKNYGKILLRMVIVILITFVIMALYNKIFNGLFHVYTTPSEGLEVTLQKISKILFLGVVITSILRAILNPFVTAVPTLLYLDLKQEK